MKNPLSAAGWRGSACRRLAAENEDELALLRGTRSEHCTELGQIAAERLLVELGELAGDRGRAITELGQRVGEARQQAVRRLEDDQRVRELRQGAIKGAALAALRRREAG